jgi:PAS domain S-box-containing protein
MSHQHLIEPVRGPRLGMFAVSGRAALGIAAALAIGLAVLPALDRTISDVPVLLFIVPIGLCAVRFGLVGGLASGAAGVAIAMEWFLEGQHFSDGLVDVGVLSIVFVLVGALVGCVASERHKLEEAIVSHHELSLDLICTASFDGYFTQLNPAWTQVLGYEREELMARPFSEFVHPDDREDTAAEVVRQTKAGEPVLNFQNRYRCRDGSYRWLEWTSRPDSRTTSLFAVARDITARKEAEQAIANYGEMLEHAVRDRTAELQQRTLELDEARRETLRRLALAAEYRDDETFQHTERVGRMAAQVAQRLGLAAEQVTLIRWAAPLHDVGKLGLSDTIVLKQGPLTIEEMEQVKKHPGKGAHILAGSNSDVLQLAERIALGHHEWWDGSGYPDGLAGEEIPLCARIVAVADVFDALTHARPYKDAWPVEQAIDEICGLRGRQFDPQIIDVLAPLNPAQLEQLGRTEPTTAGSFKQLQRVA